MNPFPDNPVRRALPKNPKVLGAVRGDGKTLIFMRDFYNIYEVMCKAAIELTDFDIRQSFTGIELDTAIMFLNRLQMVCGRVYQGGLTSHPEYCGLVRVALQDVRNDPIAQRVFALYSQRFLQATLSVPLIMHAFQTALNDDADDQTVQVHLLMTIMNGLPDDLRRRVLSELHDQGYLPSTLDVAALRRTADALLLELPDVGAQQVIPAPNVPLPGPEVPHA